VALILLWDLNVLHHSRETSGADNSVCMELLITSGNDAIFSDLLSILSPKDVNLAFLHIVDKLEITGDTV
jgi:hypothetical protein